MKKMTGFKHTNKKIQDAVNSLTKDKAKLSKLAAKIVNNIKGDTYNGETYKGKKFPGLAKSTIDTRKYLSDYNSTATDYRATRSNATFTGELIEAIDYDIKGGKIVIEAKGNHSPYKGKRGAYKHTPRYSDILKGLWDLGREIMGVSNVNRKIILSEVKRIIRRSLLK